MIKILMGGSPCTHWSIAQSKDRETKAEGVGWELFLNYVIAKEKFKPDFFLYENNWSASKEIKEQIQQELGYLLIRINSKLVSAQNRDRFYICNWENEQPEDRGILLKDILQTNIIAETINTCGTKSYTIKAQYGKNGLANFITNGGFAASAVAEPVRIGTIESNVKNIGIDIIVSINAYEVKDGKITIKGKQYPIKLADGHYIIRKLTPIECERLQTMPDGYTEFSAIPATPGNLKKYKNKMAKGEAKYKLSTGQIVYPTSATQRYKGLGNGWTMEVIKHLMSKPLKDVPKDEKIILLSMYDGIGTAYQVLKELGFTNVECHAYEIDEKAMAIAMYNHPDIIQHGDAFQVRNNAWKI